MNIAVIGNGVMGGHLKSGIDSSEDLNLVGIIETFNEPAGDKVFGKLEDITEKIDVIIDFSHISNVDMVLEFAKKTKTAVVMATTGFSDEKEKEIEEAGKEIPILFASNTSLGVNVFVETLKRVAPMLADEFDIELIEKHHNRKLDSPSGTAKTLLHTINESLEEKRTLVHGREGMEKRKKDEIGVHAVRGGSIVGEHSVIFAGQDEIFEIKHEAFSRRLFATGALKAARFLGGKPVGFYTMGDVLGL